MLDTALGKLAQKIGEAREGSEKTSLAFTALGLDVNKLAEESAGNALKDIADAISKIPAPADRAAIAVELFGKRGRELVNMLDEGRDGIDKFVAEGERVGAVLGDQQAKQLSEGEKALKELQAAWAGLWNELAEFVLPILKEVAHAMTEIIAFGNKMAGVVRDAISTVTFGLVDSTAAIEAATKAQEKHAEVHKVAGANIVATLKKQQEAQKEAAKEAEKAARDAQRQADELARTIRSALDNARSPMEKINAEVERNVKWFQEGRINVLEYERLMSKAADEAERLNKEHKETFRDTPGIAAADINTMAGAALQLTAAQNARDIAAERIEVAEQQLAAQNRMAEYLRIMSEQQGSGVSLNLAVADY